MFLEPISQNIMVDLLHVATRSYLPVFLQLWILFCEILLGIEWGHILIIDILFEVVPKTVFGVEGRLETRRIEEIEWMFSFLVKHVFFLHTFLLNNIS